MKRRIILFFCLTFLLGSVFADSTVAEAGSLQGALKEILRQVETEPEIRVAGEKIFMVDELLQFYAEREYQPFWSTASHAGREQVRTLLDYLDTAPGAGLCSADYHLPFFRELLAHFTINENFYGLPRLRWSSWYDILLTDAFFHYSRHMIEGRVPADSVQEGWNLRKPKVDLAKVINFAFANEQLEKVLHDFQPAHEDYLELVSALERYRDVASFGGWPAIPPGESLRPGMNDERVPLLRTRLLLSGDLDDLPPSIYTRLENSDVDALKRFQRRHGLKPDGVLGEQTLNALNVSARERVQQIELNLERWRWLPKNLERKYLLVNIADFSVSIVEDGRTVLSMPVVVGTSYRKTPVFSARLEYIEFAPYWYVPKTILEEDKLPLIRRDPRYLERNHYELVSWDRESIVEPESIDWDEIDVEEFPGLLRQKPGPWNALGQIKFMLPNSYAVYLHDTNERHLFRQRNRQFSSGCIRLKRPAELAAYLLESRGWDEDDVAEALTRKKPKQVYLKKALPVHVLYWTAWVDDAGLVNFRDDVYGRDQDLLQALYKTPSGCRLHKPEIALQ